MIKCLINANEKPNTVVSVKENLGENPVRDTRKGGNQGNHTVCVITLNSVLGY